MTVNLNKCLSGYRFDAELGIHKPVQYFDFTTVRRLNKKD